jgi:hypothetical protein
MFFSSIFIRRARLSPAALAFLAILTFLAFVAPGAQAEAVNRTIDDQTGDSVTGLKPRYQPFDKWSYGPDCKTCLIKPDPGMTFNGSWHDTTITDQDPPLNITLKFNGELAMPLPICIRSL